MTEPELPSPAPETELGSPPTPGSALGRDPFEEIGTPDPFVERLDALELRRERGPRVRLARPRSASAPAPDSQRRHPRTADSEPERPAGAVRGRFENIARLTRRRWSTTPTVAEIELPDPERWVDRLLNTDERRRLAALAHLVEGEAPYDRFGFSPDTIRSAFPFFHALYRAYFRVRSEGHENIPTDGPVVIAGNHGGLLPFDGAMGIVDIALHTDPPRLARTIVDRWAGTLPWINIFFARVGQVIGTRENFRNLLEDGQLVMVFPEGTEGIRKTITQRYRLQPFRMGFVEHALRCRAPIVPTAFVGSDDQSPILFDVKPLAKWLGIPVAPITPTFPWFGPLGLLPYPVSYKIVYGEPLRYHERFGPDGADDSRLVRYLANQVRRSVQLLIDRNR